MKSPSLISDFLRRLILCCGSGGFVGTGVVTSCLTTISGSVTLDTSMLLDGKSRLTATGVLMVITAGSAPVFVVSVCVQFWETLVELHPQQSQGGSEVVLLARVHAGASLHR